MGCVVRRGRGYMSPYIVGADDGVDVKIAFSVGIGLSRSRHRPHLLPLLRLLLYLPPCRPLRRLLRQLRLRHLLRRLRRHLVAHLLRVARALRLLR